MTSIFLIIAPAVCFSPCKPSFRYPFFETSPFGAASPPPFHHLSKLFDAFMPIYCLYLPYPRSQNPAMPLQTPPFARLVSGGEILDLPPSVLPPTPLPFHHLGKLFDTSVRIYCLYLPSSRPQNLVAPMQTPHFAIHPLRPPAGQKNKIQLAIYRFNSRDMEMIYGSNESGKPVLFASPD